jgi:hypothetical protein
MLSFEEKIAGMVGIILLLSFINAFVFYFHSNTTNKHSEITKDPIDVYIYKITNHYETHSKEEKSEEQIFEELEKQDERKEGEIVKQLVNQHNYMFEYTPIGYVIMKYNNEINGFEYYANRSLPYRLLEALAKKFVMIFGCKKLYKHMKHEVKKTETQKKIQHKTYAKLKPIQKEKIEKIMNIYHFKGKTNEFNFLQSCKLDKVGKDNQIEFSYSDFKRKNTKNKK